jgi:glycerol uptake facilitator-like aquaporin
VHWAQLPVYVGAEVAGAVLAGLLYVFVLNRPAAQAAAGPAAQPIAAEKEAVA